jgi:putative hydrolase of the HAD superfamily
MSSTPGFDLSSIRVCTFDLDDTLWECMPVIRKAEQSMLSHLEIKGYLALKEQLTHPVLGKHISKVTKDHPHKAHDVTFVRRTVIRSVAESHMQGTTSAEQLAVLSEEVFQVNLRNTMLNLIVEPH